jgi:hypothetical protein
VWEDQDLVFPNYTGGPGDPGTVSTRFKNTLRRLGLPAIRFHDPRHTAASLLLSAGTHPKIVSEMLGHSTIVLTLDTYSDVVPVLHSEDADTMEQLLAFGSPFGSLCSGHQAIGPFAGLSAVRIFPIRVAKRRVRKAGLEPARGYPQRFLRPQRLPFRHFRATEKRTPPEVRRYSLERKTGFEPATFSLARRCSTN